MSALLRILAVAVTLRALWIAFCPNEPISDQKKYHFGAASLAKGLGYLNPEGAPDNYHPVGYSAAIAPFYWALGAEPSSAFLANLLFAVPTVLGVYLLARELFGSRVARLAALGAAIYPTFVLYTTLVASENAYIPAMVWTVWLSIRLAKAERALPLALLTGVVLAAAIYVRSTIVLLLPVLVLIVWLQRRSLVDCALRGGIVLTVAGALLVPWALRNKEHFGEATPLSMNGGLVLWIGNHPGGDGAYALPPAEIMALPTAARDRELARLAREFIISNPGRYLQLCVIRTIRTLSSDTSAVRWNEPGLRQRIDERWLFPLKLATSAVHGILLALVLVHLARLALHRRWSRPDTIIAAVLATAAVPFVFMLASDRYHLPMTAFLIIWASALLAGRSGGEPAAPTAA